MLLYKYMPLKKSFFDEPMLRATPLSSLNDPFEGLINDRQIREMNSSIEMVHGPSDHQQTDGYDLEYAHEEQAGLFQEDLADLGVLAFTEDFTNPLMWAHYADEHRGLVVEFDLDQPLLTNSKQEYRGRKCRCIESSVTGHNEYPQKVMYRREIPGFMRQDVVVPNDKYDYQYKEFIRTILLTKSNDWVYEKEHRSIVELSEADRFICDDSKDLRSLCESDRDIELKELRGENPGRIQITFPREYGTFAELGDDSVRTKVFYLSRAPSTVHLFRINPKALRSVYFGLRCADGCARKEISGNAALQHLSVFRMKINTYQYQLDAIPAGHISKDAR